MRSVPTIVFAWMFLIPAAAHAQELNPDDFKSVIAKRAIREYLDRGEKATKQFLKEKEAATKDLVEELEKVLKQETADANLDEALKVRKTIDVLKKNVESTPYQLMSRLEGRWKIKYSAGRVFYEDFIERGDQYLVKRWIEPDKKLETEPNLRIQNGEIWVMWGKGDRLDRLHLLSDGRLMIEHWYMGKSKSTDRFPDQFAIGEKVE